MPEVALRTGGFVAEFDDPRQLGMLFGAMDQLLAGALPYYRVQLALTGSRGTFVAGGNVKLHLQIRVPSTVPSLGPVVNFDVAIP